MKNFLLPFLFSLAGVLSAQPTNFVVLETDGAKASQIVAGDKTLSKKAAPPASTFKILIAWAGIEEGLATPGTKHLCADKYVPDTPRELTLQEALYYSSNDYFIWLGAKLGAAKLESYIRKSQFAEIPASGWINANLEMLPAGGKITVTPEQQHRFISKVANGQLTSSAKMQAMLEQSLSWPSSNPQTKLYGKTGTHNGAVWYNGFGRTETSQKLVTVYIPYEAPNGMQARQKAIEIFYSRFGQKPTP